MKSVVYDCFGVVGVGCIVSGIACWSWPLAFIVLGSVFLFVGLVGARSIGYRGLR